MGRANEIEPEGLMLLNTRKQALTEIFEAKRLGQIEMGNLYGGIGSEHDPPIEPEPDPVYV